MSQALPSAQPGVLPGALPLLTVYFDGSCPLCRREIAIYQRLPQALSMAWVDVSTGQDTGGLSCEAAMARFHVRDSQGRLFSGAAAFSVMWRLFPAGAGWAGCRPGRPCLGRLSGLTACFCRSDRTCKSGCGGGRGRLHLEIRPVFFCDLAAWLAAWHGFFHARGDGPGGRQSAFGRLGH